MNAIRGAIRRSGARSRIAAARMCCERITIAAVARRPADGRGRVLCYHATGTPAWGVNDISPARFRRHIDLALTLGHRFVPAEDLARGIGHTGDLAITFDDGLASVAEHAASFLATLGIPWTLFVVCDWADGLHDWSADTFLHWQDIERLAARGATIGSHSVSHPNLAHLPLEQAAFELAESRRIIAKRIGIDPTAFAIPMGQSSDWSEQIQALAGAAGYEHVYAQSEDRRTAGTIGRTFITRFDSDRIFCAALGGAFDRWEEWV